MSLMSERHYDATLAADQSDERLTVSQWHDLLLRCVATAHRRADVRLTFRELYSLIDAALQEAIPDRYPDTTP